MSLAPTALLVAAALTLTPSLAMAQGKADTRAADGPAPPEPKNAAQDADIKDMHAPKANVEPPHEEWQQTDVEELPGKAYFFVGLRYRGNIIPKFMLNLFVDEGKTIYSNSVGAEFEIRKNGFSFIPALTFTELGTGDILFKEKNSADIAANYTYVNSGLKVIYATADVLWSAKLSRNVEFEYGLGFGLGVVFGDLTNNWLREDPNGQFTSESGKRLTPCERVIDDPQISGCKARDHKNSDVDKVGGYKEKDWFSGGSKPILFPFLAIPQIGLRFKPIKQMVARLGLGFSLTGFWFGLSGQYGLEQPPKP